MVDATTGNPTPTGLVQFQLNGENVGNPATIANGQATLTTPVNGNVGSNNLTAFYEGDATYTESTSATIPITISSFADLSRCNGSGRSGGDCERRRECGQQLHQSHQSDLHHALQPDRVGVLRKSEFDYRHRTGTTHREHHACASLERQQTGNAGWLAAGGGASLACIVLLALPRRKGRGTAMQCCWH